VPEEVILGGYSTDLLNMVLFLVKELKTSKTDSNTEEVKADCMPVPARWLCPCYVVDDVVMDVKDLAPTGFSENDRIYVVNTKQILECKNGNRFLLLTSIDSNERFVCRDSHVPLISTTSRYLIKDYREDPVKLVENDTFIEIDPYTGEADSTRIYHFDGLELIPPEDKSHRCIIGFDDEEGVLLNEGALFEADDPCIFTRFSYCPVCGKKL